MKDRQGHKLIEVWGQEWFANEACIQKELDDAKTKSKIRELLNRLSGHYEDCFDGEKFVGVGQKVPPTMTPNQWRVRNNCLKVLNRLKNTRLPE